MGDKLRPALLFSLLLGVILLVTGCVTEGELREQEPNTGELAGPLLKKQIAMRITNLKYQRGMSLYDTLNWLILYGEMAVPQLLESMADPDPRTRSYCSYILSEIGDPKVIPVLRDALAEENHKLVRYEISASLVTLGDWAQLGVLINGLEEESKRYRHKCFEVLRKHLNLTLGYDPDGPAEERTVAVSKWAAWWQRNQNNFSPILSKK